MPTYSLPRFRFGLSLSLCAVLSACTPSAEHSFSVPHLLASPEAIRAIGLHEYQRLLERADKNQRLDSSPEALERVQGIAKRIIQEAGKRFPHTQQWDWEIHTLKVNAENAFCYPGGKMIVTEGMIRLTKADPDLLAVVIGHEVSHALLEHSHEKIALDWSLYSGLWIIGKSLKFGQMRGDVALGSIDTVFRPMERKQEKDADRLGLELMASAGFNPVAAARFWEIMAQSNPVKNLAAQRLEAYLSTHPNSEDRHRQLRSWANDLQARPDTSLRAPSHE